MRPIFRYLAVALITFMAGGFFMLFDIWPMGDVKGMYRYLFLDERWWRHSPKEIVLNDIGLMPYRHFAPLDYVPDSTLAFSKVEIPNLSHRRDPPLVYVNEARARDVLTLIAGLIDANDGLYGVLLLDPEGKVVRRWAINPGEVAPKEGDEKAFRPSGEFNRVLHGLAVLSDGSLIVALQGSKSLTRYDACGALMWQRPIRAHHSVTMDGEKHVWTWDENDMVRVDVVTGEVVKRVSLETLAERAPGKYILTSRKFFDRRGTYFGNDPFHANHVEALPADYAEAFPMFDAGDLLVSLRSGNLIFVVDPDTGEIVWWMQDGSFGQHDPDWQADGSILLFDNNTDYGSSRVIRINPAMKSYEIVLDGNDLGFYTDLMGNQHRRADGATILALAREGRAVEYADDGTLLFEFINLYDEAEQRRGLVTEARTLPLAFLDNLPECDD